jgi:hypothetical protein
MLGLGFCVWYGDEVGVHSSWQACLRLAIQSCCWTLPQEPIKAYKTIHRPQCWHLLVCFWIHYDRIVHCRQHLWMLLKNCSRDSRYANYGKLTRTDVNLKTYRSCCSFITALRTIGTKSGLSFSHHRIALDGNIVKQSPTDDILVYVTLFVHFRPCIFNINE